MVSARSIRAGAAYVELTVKDGQLVRGLERAKARLKAFSAGISDLGRKLMGLSALGGAPLIFGAKTFADFDKQMAMVSTMLDKPEEHMQRFTEGIRKMSVRFGEDTGALAKGLYDILSASVAPEHALRVLEATMRAARGGITDAATATQAIINVLNAFHIPASRAGEVADMLFTTVRRGVLTFEEMAQSVVMVTATAAAAGLSMDDMGAAIATMTRNGLKADMAAVALQNILKEFLDPSKQGAALAKKYGIELSTMGLKADGLLCIMKKLSALPADVIAKIFPNIRGLRGIYALRGDVAGLAKDLDMMRNKAGATDTAFGKMDRTLSASFAKLWQSLKLVSSAIGEAIAPTLQKWMGDLTKILGNVARWISQNKQLVVSFMKWVAIIGAVGAALIGLAGAATLASVVIGGLGTIFSAITGILSGIVTIGTWLITTLGAGLAALASPLGIIVGGFIALVAGMAYAGGYGGKLLSWLGKRFDALKSDALAAFQGIKDALIAGDFGLAARILWLTLKMEWQKGIHWLTEWWVAFKEVFMRTATDAFYGAVKILAGAWDGMRALWVITVNFLSKVWTNFTAGVQKAWNSVQGFLTKGFLKVMSLWDENITEESYRNIDRETQQKNQGIEQKRQAALQESERQYRDDLARIGQDYEGTVSELNKEAAAAHANRRKRYQDELRASQDAVDKAKQEWRDALAEAARKRAEAEAEQPEAPVVDDIAQKLKAAGQALGDTLRNIEVKGTFSAIAARGMGIGSNAAERTADATEETARNTRRILDEVEDGGLAFG